jgi:hypothetical protein
MPRHVLRYCPGRACFLASQLSRVRTELPEVLDRQTRVEYSIDVNEYAVSAAEEVARLFGKRKRWADFGYDLADRGKVNGFGIQQLLDKLFVLFGFAHLILLVFRGGKSACA